MSALRWVLGFFEVQAPQSMTRLIALLCGLSGCAVAIIAACHRDGSQTLNVSALIGGGAVALLTRSKPSGGAGSPSATNSPEIG